MSRQLAPAVLTNAARSALRFLKSVPGIFVAVGCVALVVAVMTGNLRLSAGGAGSASSALPASDVPPLEFIYLDTARVDNYLGQMEGGLSKSQQRSDQVTKAISATLSGSCRTIVCVGVLATGDARDGHAHDGGSVLPLSSPAA